MTAAPKELPVKGPRRGIVVLLTALVAFGPLSTDLYLPSLPSIVTALDTDIQSVQLTLSVFLVGFAASQLIYGPLSDRLGRRPVVLGGVSIFVLASVACALAPTIETLVVARFFQAFGACCGPVLGRAIVRDLYGRDRAASVLAYMAMAMAVAPALGPIIGGYLTVWFGWEANFWLLAGFGGTILVAATLSLSETNRYPDPGATRPSHLLANYRILLAHKPYVGFVLVVSCTYSAIFSFISGSAYVFIDGLGLSPSAYGLCFAAIVVGYMIGSFAAGRISQRWGIHRMISLGLAISLTASLIMAGLPILGYFSVSSVVFPFMLFMVGAGLTLPNAMAGAIGPFPRMAGLASSFLGFAQMGIAAGVGIVVGYYTDGGPLPMAIAILGAAALAPALYHGLIGRSPPAESMATPADQPGNRGP